MNHIGIPLGPSIIIATHGWVYYADAVEKFPQELVLHNPKTIRSWGTEWGLGQLAAGGPTPKTVLDPMAPTMTVERVNVIGIVPCVSPW